MHVGQHAAAGRAVPHHGRQDIFRASKRGRSRGHTHSRAIQCREPGTESERGRQPGSCGDARASCDSQVCDERASAGHGSRGHGRSEWLLLF
eukprot:1140115-Pelagomonas_calceolata.AAC.17